MKLNTLINTNKVQFNKFYNKILNQHLSNSILGKAMKYGSMNGGKRIRPYLVKEASKIVKLNKNGQRNKCPVLAASDEQADSCAKIY